MWANAQRDGRPAEYRWCASVERRSLADAHYYSAVQIFGDVFGSCICSEPRAAPFRPAF